MLCARGAGFEFGYRVWEVFVTDQAKACRNVCPNNSRAARNNCRKGGICEAGHEEWRRIQRERGAEWNAIGVLFQKK
jgi:hypothetical protein